MSILNYFQNNATNLDVVRLDEFGLRVADYVTHISECARWLDARFTKYLKDNLMIILW